MYNFSNDAPVACPVANVHTLADGHGRFADFVSRAVQPVMHLSEYEREALVDC